MIPNGARKPKTENRNIYCLDLHWKKKIQQKSKQINKKEEKKKPTHNLKAYHENGIRQESEATPSGPGEN